MDKTNRSQGKKEKKEKGGHVTASKHHCFDSLYIYEGVRSGKVGNILQRSAKNHD